MEIDLSALMKGSWSIAKILADFDGSSPLEHLPRTMKAGWASALAAANAKAIADIATVPQQAQQQQACAAPAAEVVEAPIAAVEPSVGYKFGRVDRRCRAWERVIREGVALPAPEDVSGAADLPGAYAPDRGEEELFGLDAVLQGEENHHRRARGWTYWLHVRNPATGKIVTMKPTAERKAVIKAAIRDGRIALPLEILKGAGDIAALVRILTAIRAGLPIEDLLAEAS